MERYEADKTEVTEYDWCSRSKSSEGLESAPIILSSPFFLPHTHTHRRQPLIPEQILIENTTRVICDNTYLSIGLVI